MLTDQPAVRKALHRIVLRLEENLDAREDLFQEALVYFWSKERQSPGQRLSWYLQSVSFYLHHLRTHGRSLDSTKRRGAQAAYGSAALDEWLDSLDLNEGIMSEVSAREITNLLLSRLEPAEKKIFKLLADGLGTRQIARTLRVSHQSVIRHRRKIAMSALTLGIAPLGAPPKRAPSNR
jgi:RNA polymerase sigma factor (sigma-70 family)